MLYSAYKKRLTECAVKTLQAAMFVTVKEMRAGPS